MSDTIVALIIEEREVDFLALKAVLASQTEWHFSTRWAKTYKEGLQQFKNIEIDICFLDAKLGIETGHDFLDQLKGLKHHVPIILVGHQTDKKAQALDENDGVDDFLYRDKLTPLLVSKAIKYGIESYKHTAELRLQKEKYSQLFHSSLEAVFTADKHYQILECNDVFKDLLKIEKLDGFDFRTLFINSDYESIFQSISESAKKKQVRTKVANTHGEVLEVYVSISKILYSEDKTSYQGVIHDITELEKAQKEAIEADKLKLMSRMARILGHEVRNPLSNILLASEEMRTDNEENEDLVLMTQMIHRNANRISTLIDSFLNNTRHSETEKENIAIETVILQAIENCKDRMALKRINFIMYGLDTETTLLIDKQKITIALTNILINAIEALEYTAQPKLFVDFKVEDNHVLITIKDNGSGMSEEVQDNLFTPFYSSKQGGLGLGMANTKNIFDAHEATITVESALNEGTSFFISLPRKQ